jgi:hypothetical protein
MMSFDRRYWIFIACALIVHTVAILCTYYAIEIQGSFECNPIMADAFSSWGYVITSLFSLAVIVLVMLFVPYLLRENNKLGLLSGIILGIFTFALFFDAFHDLLVISGSDLAYSTRSVIDVYIHTLNIDDRCVKL